MAMQIITKTIVHLSFCRFLLSQFLALLLLGNLLLWKKSNEVYKFLHKRMNMLGQISILYHLGNYQHSPYC